MIVAGFFESKKNHGNELIEKLEAGMQDMLQIVEDRKRDVVAPKLKENLQYVGGEFTQKCNARETKKPIWFWISKEADILAHLDPS